MNQDGRSQGLSAPNGPAQQRVILDALSSCGLSGLELDAVEAHGTGTMLGDPIEAGALAAVLGADRPAERPLYVGSSKSNLGHTQAAAGVAGVMKMVLSLQHELLPKTLHAEEPSPHIAWDGSGLCLLQEARAWRRGERVRRAGVSSFGISGTNAHVVLEEAPIAEAEAAESEGQAALPSALPLLVSGRDASALRAQAERLRSWLEEHPQVRFVDVVHTAALHRAQLDERAVIVASRSESLEALEALAKGAEHRGVVRGRASATGKVVFVFPGQGSQWSGMGKALLAQSEVFAASVRACDAALSPWTGWSVLSLLQGEASAELPPVERVDAVQTALFTMSVSLAALWRSLGLEPSAVVGHSQGEVAAAVVSGALSLGDGARVVAVRSQAVRRRCGEGGMLLIERPLSEVEQRLKAYGAALSVAAVNTSSSTVVSGENGALASLQAELESASVFCRQVNVDYASHSAQMDVLLPGLSQELGEVAPRAGQIPFYSTVESARLDGSELDGSYWCRNLREPVRFDRALAQLLEAGHGVFVEVSPHPVLGVALRSGSEDAGGVVIGSLQRDEGGLSQLLHGLGVLHAHGHAVDWERVLSGYGGRRVELPTYAFQRERYWLDAGKGRSDARSLGLVPVEHPLLGALTPLADSDGWVFSSRLSLSDQSWLGDHAVQGTVLVPGTALLELALHAARMLGLSAVSELTLEQPLVLSRERGSQLQVSVTPPDGQGNRGIAVYSREGEERWQQHASGSLSGGPSPEAAPPTFETLRSWPVAGAERIALDGFYERARQLGFEYGPTFQGLVEAWRAGSVGYGRVVLPEPVKGSAEHYGLHPALLDAALHTVMASGVFGELDAVQLPFAWSEVRLYATGASELRVRVERHAEGERALSVLVADGTGELVASIGSLHVRSATAELAGGRAQLEHLYRVEFQPVPLEVAEPGALVVLGGSGALARALGATWYATLSALLAASDSTAPVRVIVDATESSESSAQGAPGHVEFGSAVAASMAEALSLLQGWLAEERLSRSELVWLTRNAVGCGSDWEVEDLVSAPLWGLVRSARTEHPERPLRLVDVSSLDVELGLLARGLAAKHEPELALRAGVWLGARICAMRSGSREGTLELPGTAGAWRLSQREKGRLDSFELARIADAEALLAPDEVQVSVRASGMNFRDVLNALDMVNAPALGFEYAGVVQAVGAAVTSVAVGDRVMGLGLGAFGSEVRSDGRLVVKIPERLSFAQAATVPLAYLTALYAFEDLGELRAGDKVLVHAAAGGVGMAAVQLAHAAGAEVFGTASEGKWPVLRAQGLDERHISSSRDVRFERKWLAETAGQGFDVVLNALTKEYVDASLRLLPRGGRFLEMGKLDIRAAAEVSASYPGVRYVAFELLDAGFERLSALLRKLAELLSAGVVQPLPFSAYEVRHAPSAFRHMAQARHVGKLVLQMPRALERGGTVLITGGTGELGAAVAEHLVTGHGVKHLVLTSRRGEGAPGARALIERLQTLGAETVQVHACDVTVRSQVAEVLARVPRPLTGVFHLSGVLDDGLVRAQTAERLSAVLAPKVAGAWHLHELTAGQDLACFVLFSSAAGTLGGAGQSNYAAANAFLDALAAHRRKRGLAGVSLAWGLWQPSGVGLTSHLGQADLARMARLGMAPLSQQEGLSLLDAALTRPEALLVPIRLELTAMQRAFEQAGGPPALWRGLIRPALRRASASRGEASALRERLSTLPEADRLGAVLELVQSETAAVLGLSGPSAVPADKELQKLGLDSLMAVELRNRLSTLASTKLPATLAFDYPTPGAIAGWLLKQAFGELASPPTVRKQPALAGAAEPIAIVSMACRLPGGVESPDAFWELLASERDAMQPFPERWAGLDLYDPTGQGAGKSCTDLGAFVDGIDQFDAGFFGISPREAQVMDPQQRLVLETAWQALERAGLTQTQLRESATGVYLGACGSEYSYLSVRGIEDLDGFNGANNTVSLIAGRLSYVLGLQGPSLTVDTACSSSLVALHLACTALRLGECDLALAGGVTLMLLPWAFVEFTRLGATSPDGRCKSFSSDANGTAWGEGCGILVLKRLSDAQRDGDRVLALVRGTAVNQDGRSQGLTAPNGPSQQRVIQDALAASQLSSHDIDAIEAHGTGTALGDPIEAGALAAVFATARDPERPVYLGSSKSNLGHTIAAAGVTGVMKMVLALQHERLPKTLHVEALSPHIEWQDSGLCVLQQARDWRRGPRVRRAGVSSFGMSGTNAHVVLEEAPALADEPRAAPAVDGPLPLLVSAHDERALGAQARQLAGWLARHPEAPWVDVVHTAALRRSHFDERALVLAESAMEARIALDALAEAQPHPALLRGKSKPGGKVVFVFPGQGSQWLGMGKALLEQSPVFAESARACDEALARWTGWSVLALLRGETSEQLPPPDRVDAVQAALFTMYVSLSALWRELGLEPAAVVGHSQGEVAAAVVSGALSLEDGAHVTAARGQAVRRRCGQGAMLLVERALADVEQRLIRYGQALSIAAVNTASSLVVSGEPDAIAALQAELTAESVFCRQVNVDYASHSAQMDALLPELERALSTLTPRAGRIPLYSTVDGGRFGGEELDATYWCRNLRQTVRLDRALEQLIEDGHGVFVEVSPHPVLTLPLHGACDASGGVVIASLQRDRGELSQLYRGLGELYVQGQAVAWQPVLQRHGGRAVELPTYAFQRERYWVDETKARGDARSMGLTAVEHPLLGAMTPLADSDGYLFSSRLSLREQPWLADHAVQGTVLVPGTGMLELALHAGRAAGLNALRELALEQPLVLAPDAALQLQLSVGGADEQGERKLALYGRAGEGAWTQHATGVLCARSGHDADAHFDELRSWPVARSEPVELEGFYAQLEATGLRYGPAFQGLVELRRAGQVAYGRAVLPDAIKASAERYGLHPALFDAALHTMLAFRRGEQEQEVWLPFSWSDLELHATGANELRVRIELNAEETSDQITASVVVSDGLGEPVASARALRVRRARLDALQRLQGARSEHLYRVEFQPVPLEVAEPGQLAVLGGSGALARALGAAWHVDVPALLAQSEAAPPALLIVDATEAPPGELASAVHVSTRGALALLQQWLAEERFAHTELVWLTRSAIGCGPNAEVEDLVHAPLWGLVRSARSEHPERSLRLVDIATFDLDAELLSRGLWAKQEPELVLRGDAWLAARLRRVPQTEHAEEPLAQTPRSLDPAGTVLLTGGTGELGAALAQHLVTRHGVKHLVLTSRRGADAPGARALIERLQTLGAETVRVLACDVTARAEVADVLARVPGDHPLTGVFHLSAVLDDGLVASQTAERLSSVLAPKVDGAWHLHELTKAQELACFVLFSSAAGTLGGAGQSNYAAANAFLDALAAHRQQRGLAGTSLAWGLWQPSGVGLTSRLGQADFARLARLGIAPLSQAQALALLDTALVRPEPALVPIRLELAALQRQLEQVTQPPALLRALLRPGLRKASSGGRQLQELRDRLSALSEPERLSSLLELVRGEVAAVLALSGPQTVNPDKPLQELGLDSLTAVELRNRLSGLVGTTVPATVAFDYPTPRALCRWLLSALDLGAAVKVTKLDIELAAEALLRATPEQIESHGLASLLRSLREQLALPAAAPEAAPEEVDLEDREQLMEFLEQKLGVAE